MYLFASDETNREATQQNRFFIYGGILVCIPNAPVIHFAIERLRRDHGYQPTDQLKFTPNSRPAGVSVESFNQLKDSVLNLAIEQGTKFMATAVHHELARDVEFERKVLYALNTLLCHFDLFLGRNRTTGLCVCDRLGDGGFDVHRRIFTEGIHPRWEGGITRRRLDNIWLLGFGTSGTSHIASVCDIVLGAFRYCVNASAVTEPVQHLWPKVRRLILAGPNNPEQILEWGIFLRPRDLRCPTHQHEYRRLQEWLLTLDASIVERPSVVPRSAPEYNQNV